MIAFSLKTDEKQVFPREINLLKSKVNTNQIQVTGLLYLPIYDSLIFLVSLSLKIFPFIYFSIVVDLNWELKELRPVVRG